ncbi:hypothetical protein E3E23_06285 [Thermococcus sp. CX2]|uniref:hypothetical protein n=1 Tax=Thermococcus sp. CX2 TaxID=163006 RepID=UPI001439F0B9|nr:hypothetical protein [Thermococcus sp. CX2]NJE85431.1 hypothetical protein [Thermococcus sp. CX2]
MRKLIVLILTLLLIGSPLAHVAAAGEPQPLFKIDMMIQVSPDGLAQFRIYATLKDPFYRAYFNKLAANNTTLAEEQFQSFVKSLIYDNLKDNFEKRFEAKGLNSTIYWPEGGPVKVLDNWSAVVAFAITNFLVSDGKVLSCPLSGPMEFVFRGHVFAYSWDKLTLILPKDYEVRNLAPAPEDFSNNVAVWTNGDFIPLMELYTPQYSYWKFLNATWREISLRYDPQEGYVQFNATFSGANATPLIINQIISSFKARMEVISIDARQENGSLVVIGVAKPEVSHSETSSEEVWNALVKLPMPFNKVLVKGGSYQVGPNNTIIITVVEKKPNYFTYLWIGLILVVVVGIAWLKKRRTASKEMEEPAEEGNESSIEESESLDGETSESGGE